MRISNAFNTQHVQLQPPSAFPCSWQHFQAQPPEHRCCTGSKTSEHFWPVLEAFLVLQLKYFSLDATNVTLNNSCESRLPKQRTPRGRIMERWNVLVRESTTEHKIHLPPWKSEQRTRVWRGSKAEGTNCGSLLARPWGDTAMANLPPVCSTPTLGRCEAGWPPGAPAPSHQRDLPGDCSSTGTASCTHVSTALGIYISVNYPLQASVHPADGWYLGVAFTSF